MSQFSYTFFKYLDEVKRTLLLSPTILGGFSSGSGGSGGPPGGFQGFLPQTRVAYDTTEAEIQGFISPNPYNPSGVLVSGSLLDNLNHIRYRISVVEAAAGISGGGSVAGNIEIKNDGSVVDSTVTVLNFSDDFVVTSIDSSEVEINLATIPELTNIGKVYVSNNDTTPNYLQQKIVEGDNISFTVVDDGSNEQLRISSSGDHKVAVTSGDASPNYISAKLVAGDGLDITISNEGADEKLDFIAWGDRKVLVSDTDTFADTISNKIVAGENVGINILNPGDNEQLEIVASGGTGSSVANLGLLPDTQGVQISGYTLDITDYPTLRNVTFTADPSWEESGYLARIVGGNPGDLLLIRPNDGLGENVTLVTLTEPSIEYEDGNIWSNTVESIIFSDIAGDYDKELQFAFLINIGDHMGVGGSNWLLLHWNTL